MARSAKSSRSVFSRILVFFALLAPLLAGIVYYIENNLNSFYIFETDHLHDLAKRGIAKHRGNTKAIVDYIVDELAAKNPEHVNTNSVSLSEEWFFNNAGGAMGGMYVIHASITEYLIIFGTAIGTEGHTGRHTADDYFHILTGTQTAYRPGDFKPEVYPAGSMHHLRRGEVKQYKMPEGCFALEYARGWIPPMLFFGYADGFTSTLDLPTLWTMTKISAREIVGNLLKGKI